MMMKPIAKRTACAPATPMSLAEALYTVSMLTSASVASPQNIVLSRCKRWKLIRRQNIDVHRHPLSPCGRGQGERGGIRYSTYARPLPLPQGERERDVRSREKF